MTLQFLSPIPKCYYRFIIKLLEARRPTFYLEVLCAYKLRAKTEKIIDHAFYRNLILSFLIEPSILPDRSFHVPGYLFHTASNIFFSFITFPLLFIVRNKRSVYGYFNSVFVNYRNLWCHVINFVQTAQKVIWRLIEIGLKVNSCVQVYKEPHICKE